MKLPSVNETVRISIVAVHASPRAKWLATVANSLMTPVRTRAPTMTNSPAKNSSVSHSTLAR